MAEQVTSNYITLGDWFLGVHSDSDVRKLFISMDYSLRTLHENNLCVYHFYPTEIYVDGNTMENVVFNSTVNLEKDSIERKKMIEDDLFKQGIIHFSYYYYQTDKSVDYYDLLNNMNRFFSSDFSSYSSCFPEEDVDYYRQLFVNKEYSYYGDYVESLKNKDGGNGKGNHYVKKGAIIGYEPIVSEYDTNKALKNDDAYVNMILIPLIISIVLIALVLFKIVLSI